jgi:type I restriction enzyme, R subunit
MSAIGQPNRSLYDNNKTVYSLLRYGVPAEIEAGKITDRNWPRSRPNV